MKLRAGIVGTGWMALVHTEALRRIGVDVVGMVGSTPARTRAKAVTALLPPAVDSMDELLDIPGLSAVHVTSPNHVHAEQAAAALRAGVPVICEKPLGVDPVETAALVALAAETGLVNAVCFNIRYYPQNQNAAALVADGAIGRPRFVSGCYLQDWLLLDTDWNWRLDAHRQGGLRAVGDIGSHWLDLTRFVTGRRVSAVFADLHTFVAERHRPLGEIQTFAIGHVDRDADRVVEPMHSDDAAGLLLRFEDGARGTCAVSQVSAGRKNSIAWEVDGSTSSLAWMSEDPERLWIGHRGRPNELVEKDPAVLMVAGAAAANLPGGHVEGYADTFRALFTAVYRDIAAGAPAAEPDYPTFADGHDVALVCEAITASARTGTWANVDRNARLSRPEPADLVHPDPVEARSTS